MKISFKKYMGILIWGKVIKLSILAIILFFSACTLGQGNNQKLPVKVLIVNFFETPNNQGERHLWLDNLNLKQELPFSMGNHSLYYNPDTQVLQMMTGQGNLNASVSMTALGLDPRFDFSHTYTLLAGIAGGDPQTGFFRFCCLVSLYCGRRFKTRY